MQRFPFFFALMAALAVILVGIAAAPLAMPQGQAVDGRQTNLGWVVEGADLAQVRPAEGFPVMVPPGPRGDLEGVRMTATSALAPDARFSKAVRLSLGDALAAHVAGGATTVRVIVKSTARFPAKSMAIGLVTEGPVSWSEQAIGPAFTSVTFTLPPTKTKPRALAIWPSVQGGDGGIEVKAIIFAKPEAAPALPN
ncbi:MAG: hypothetical protein ACK5XZ_08995 [Hyphomonadaceae bacterium]|uniref:hypothetical protein n=1 Tax=Aquidulcibacter sp. TaxID=2052990 RepID=UPI0022C922F7|nr:hypothetical protein [Aquidulcibacter sp.]MCE2892384.1 hypothetical protein [Hyphomonadaceae bacterium]MCZ8209528.1 hypothetical protein [Aquidulcibacter sp.]